MADGIREFGSIGGSGERGGSYGGSSSSLSEFLYTLQKYEADTLSAEEKLQQLRITNVENLGNLRKSQQKQLLEEMATQESILIDEIKQKKLDALQEEYNTELALAAELGEEEYKARKGYTIDEYKERAKKQKELINNEAKAKKAQRKIEDAEKAKQAKKDAKAAYKNFLSSGKPLERIGKAFSEKIYKIDENGNKVEAGRGATAAGRLVNLVNVLGDLTRQLDSTIEKIGGYKSAIDTRLQGSKMSKNWAGSYWEQMSSDITGIAAVSPFIKQSAIADRINEYVSQGIAFNVEQRAVIQELSGKIATTFNAANGTLLRLIRVQQQDSTAARLGMESALTAFLNNMYETTEYMSSIANSVKGSLEEAMSLMSGENALSFEYQVQKWLGSLYSVGMSDQSVQSLGSVLGKVAAGQLEAITSGGQGNLVIMAANQAGLNISDILTNGLTDSTTNELMNAMVDYLAKIAKDAGDSRVIQQQMAQVYGMTASDLRAAVNLAKSTGAVSRDGLNYATAIGRLTTMANTLHQRTSMGEMMNNMWDNVKYTMSAGIASNPVLYGIYKIANMLSDTVGGIDIPLPLVMGSGMNMGLNVANLMRVGALSGGILSNIGNIIGGLGNSFNGAAMLNRLGVTGGLTTVTRGTGAGLATTGGASVSQSGSMIGNSSGSDVQSKTMTDATDSAKAEVAQASEEDDQTKLKDIRSDVLDIYHLLQTIANGSTTIRVDVTNPELKVSTLI